MLCLPKLFLKLQSKLVFLNSFFTFHIELFYKKKRRYRGKWDNHWKAFFNPKLFLSSVCLTISKIKHQYWLLNATHRKPRWNTEYTIFPRGLFLLSVLLNIQLSSYNIQTEVCSHLKVNLSILVKFWVVV